MRFETSLKISPFTRFTWTGAGATVYTPAHRTTKLDNNSLIIGSAFPSISIILRLCQSLRLLSFADVRCQKFVLCIFWPGVHGAGQKCFDWRNRPGGAKPPVPTP